MFYSRSNKMFFCFLWLLLQFVFLHYLNTCCSHRNHPQILVKLKVGGSDASRHLGSTSLQGLSSINWSL